MTRRRLPRSSSNSNTPSRSPTSRPEIRVPLRMTRVSAETTAVQTANTHVIADTIQNHRFIVVLPYPPRPPYAP